VLVQDAVYRSAPKRLRAELHERYADRLDTESPDLPDLDEFVGYHLEQAYRLRTELGESDRRTERLAEDGGRKLGAAGIRAMKRGDNHATTNLLRRATSLLTSDRRLRSQLLTELGIARRASDDSLGAVRVFEQAIAESLEAGDTSAEARARIELEYSNLRQEPGRVADHLLEAVSRGIPIFEKSGDERALGRAWLFAGWIRGGRRANHAAWLDAAERARVHYRAARWTTSSCVGEIAAALYWGPTSVAQAVFRCEQLLQEESANRTGSAYLEVFLGGLAAQEGDFQRARTLVRSAWATLDDAGYREGVLTYCATVLGEVELLAGEPRSAVEVLDALCAELAERGATSQLASRASDLAEALSLQGRDEDAEGWTEVAERYAAPDDVTAQMMWRSVRAKLLARRGELQEAEEIALEAVRLSDRTDDLNRRAKTYWDLSDVLAMAGRGDGATEALERAARLFEEKGNRVAFARARDARGAMAVT
jgi:tetratricopeptide (TPR) repeat protein